MNKPVIRAADPDDIHYRNIAALVYAEAGIVLGPEKFALIRARLRKRISTTGCRDIASYAGLLATPAGQPELPELISAITTNVTHFFRERRHFQTLATEVVPALRDAGRSEIHAWSAGCSSGQEPLSIAMAIHEASGNMGPRPTIVATDIDTKIISRARAGLYSPEETSSLSAIQREKYFHRTPDGFQVMENLQRQVQFTTMNLLGHWNIRDKFDVIFCRNVVIYFDLQAQLALWQRFSQRLIEGGWLFIGHSERIPDPAKLGLESVGNTTYRKIHG